MPPPPPQIIITPVKWGVVLKWFDIAEHRTDIMKNPSPIPLPQGLFLSRFNQLSYNWFDTAQHRMDLQKKNEPIFSPRIIFI